MSYQPAYRLKLYRNFKALEANDFHGVIRYYEQHEDGIRTLDTEEYFDCTLTYTEALFQTGNYGKHVVMCDHMLEFIIMQNIESWGGGDVYARVLFRKAASLYQLQAYSRAEHISRELVKINPWAPWPKRLLKACMLRQRPSWLQKTRAVSVVLALLAATIIALEIFVVRPFFMPWYDHVLWAHNILLGGSVVVLCLGEILHYGRCTHAVKNFVKKYCLKKRRERD